MYRLALAPGARPVTVVGCGGTGGYVAEGLCRVIPSIWQITLVDHDRVEERNLARQNFCREDIGKYKSEVLALRLGKRFDRSIRYSVLPVASLTLPQQGIVIGCVDNGQARADIADMFNEANPSGYNLTGWWIDSGNGDNYGQVIVGNTTRGASRKGAFSSGGLCYALPLPTDQRPDLLLELPPAPSCAVADTQNPVINSFMACIVLSIVRGLIEQSCCWMQVLLDMQQGRMHAIQATPQNVAGILHVDPGSLLSREGKQKGGERR